MSTTIDNKVVEMRFDNKQFEQGVQTSMHTLDKLKQSLNLTGASKGLENVSSAARGMNFSGLSGAIETVSSKFSALEVMGVTALVNITNQAVNAGKRLAASFTIDPIKTGFQEYETQINAVQTILANTESKGTTLSNVNAALDELNTYADKTIYNFTEMTRNIGTFTAAGVDLDTSVNAIQGIANLAAVSGSTSQQASTAMYQLSQALSSGTVKLMDWNSVVNAGMGGQVFQDALKETARVHGVAIDDMIKEQGSFRETLSEGWLTSEILTETLSHFTMAAEEGTAEWESFKKSLMDQGYSEKQAESILKMSNTAESAATKVKTFSQLFDTLKEAAQSGWTQTWEIIVGDFEGAKVFLTELSDLFGGIIGSSAESRNALLDGALTSKWSKLTTMIDSAGASSEVFQDTVKSMARESGIPVDDLIEKYGSLDRAIQAGAIDTDLINAAFKEFVGTGKEATGALDNREALLSNIGLYAKMSDEQLKSKGLTDDQIKTIRELARAAEDGTGPVSELFGEMNRPSGRELLIDSLRNGLKALINIFSTVKQAWQEVFPPMTSDQLYGIIQSINEFSKKLVASQDTLDKFKSVFKGAFAVLDIGWQAIKALVGGLVDLVKYIWPVGDGILSAAANFGDFLVGVDEAVKSTGFFQKAIEGIGNFLKPIADGVKEFATVIVDAFKRFFTIDTSGIDEFSDKVQTRFSPLAKIGEWVGKAFSGLARIFEAVMPIFAKLGSIVGKAFGGLADAVMTAIDTASFTPILDVINTGLFATILIGVKKFIGSLTDIADNGGGVLGGLKDILDGVKGSLEAWQSNLKAGTLLKIAGAMAILTASVIALSLVDSAKLGSALTAITVMFAELFGSMAIFEKIMSGSGFTGITKITGAMILLSTATLILSFAVTRLAKVEWKDLLKGLAGVAVLCGTLTVSMKALSSDTKRLVKGATGMILFAAAIVVLTSAVEKLSVLSPEELTKGLVGVGVLCAELALFMKVAKLDQMGVMRGLGLLAFAGALVVMSSAVEKLASISVEGLIKGLGTIGVLLLEVALFTRLVSKGGGIVSSAVALVGIGAAMLIFAEAVGRMGNLSWEQIGKGLITMAGALVLITAAVNLMPATMALQAIGLIGIAAALVILSGALQTMGGMTWDEIARGLVVLAGSMTILVIALNLMTSAIPGALAMLVVAGALAILAPVLQSFGGMSLAEIGKGLLTMAGAFLVMGVAAAVLGPLVPAMLGLSAAIALLGVGCLAAGVGLLAFSAGLSALAVSGSAGAAALVVIFTSLMSLIPVFFESLGNGLVAFATAIAESAPVIGEALIQLVTMLVDVLVTCTPMIIDGLMILLTSLLNSLVEYGPTIVDAVFQLLLACLQCLSDNISQVVQVGIDIVLGFIEGISQKLGDIIQAGFDLIINFINGLTEAINTNTPLLVEAGKNLILALINAGLTVLSGGVSLFKEAGQLLMNNGLIKSIVEKTSAFASKVGELIKKGVQTIKNKVSEWLSAGKELISKVISGIGQKFSDIKSKVKELINNAKSAITEKLSEWTSAGKDLIEGFISGVKEKASSVIDAAKGVVSDALEGAKRLLGINSPSREFAKVGRYSDEGLVVGFKDYAGKVATAAKDVAGGALSAMGKAMSGISDIVNSEMDTQPTIRPVLDLSAVAAGAGSINGMLGMTPSIGVLSNIGAISSMMSDRQNGGNDDVVSAIDKLRESLGSHSGDTYNVGDVTYDDGSNINTAVKQLVRAAKIERRM